MSKLSEAIPNRLRALRQEKGLSLAAVAELAGTSAAQIQRIEMSTRRLTVEWVERLAAALGVDPAQLTGGDSSMATRTLPIIGSIAAGNWREAIEHAEGEVTVPSNLVGGKDSFALRASGDSMNLLVPDRGIVIIDPQIKDLREGMVYAAMNSTGETTVKRYRNNPARLEPCSSNPEHQPISLGHEPFTIIGRVLGAYIEL